VHLSAGVLAPLAFAVYLFRRHVFASGNEPPLEQRAF
jgi:hypothetical protein